MRELERRVTAKLGFREQFAVTGQTYPRKTDSMVLDALSGVAQSAAKMAGDLRLLQHEGELLEPFESEQIGSSAMAYKRNPMRAERIAGLARFVISLQANGAHTAASQWLERTLDDSANRRLTLPEAFLGADAILVLATNIAAGLEVREEVIRRHVAEQMPFMATERWLMLGVARRRRPPDAARGHSPAQPGRSGGGEPGRQQRPARPSGADPAFRGVPAAALRAELEPASYTGRAARQVGEFLGGVPPPAARARPAARRRNRRRRGPGMSPSPSPGQALKESRLPLPLLRRGKVREVYEVDAGHLLLVASDRVSAFDIVMREPIPRKGAVLTQISAFWFERLAAVVPVALRHGAERRHPRAGARRWPTTAPRSPGGRCWCGGRCRCRSNASCAATSRARRGPSIATVARSPARRSRPGLEESARLDPPLFSPATKAESGHDENVTIDRMAEALGRELTARLRDASFAVYRAGRDHAASRGIIIADTKFEFGTAADGTLLLIDEVMTPDSSRFWPADRYAPGRSQPSFDKQPLRDYLAGLKTAGHWNGEAPPPTLPPDVVDATSRRYLEAFRLITGRELEDAA